MHIRSLAVLLLCSMAVGQAPTSQVKPESKPATRASGTKTPGPENSANVPADSAVITVEGICEATTGKAGRGATPAKSACKTVITRAQFEQLAGALQPNMNAAMKRRLGLR